MTTAGYLAQPWLSPLGWSLLHFLWQGALLAALLAAVLYLLRGSAANWRYLAACTVLLLMAACPPATLRVLTSGPATDPSRPTDPRPGEFLATLHPAVSDPNARPGGGAKRGAGPRGEAGGARLNASVPPVPRSRWQPAQRLEPLLPWLVAAWLSGVLLLSLRLLGSWAAVQRLRRRGTRPITGALPVRLTELARRMGIARPVLLRESALVDAPAVIGAVRAVILLPVSALSGLTPAQLEAILVHELAHIRRHDYLINLLQTALETVLFYHPAVWWVSRCIRLERENCCDDLAVAALGDRITYARALTALEALRSAPGGLAMAANGGDLLGRIQRILGRPSPQSGPAAGWLGGILMTALLLAAAAAVHLSAAGSSLLSEPDARLIAPERSPSALEGVAGLEKSVTYTETKIPLGELIRKVAKDTGTPLVAAKEVADEPVAVIVKDFSARTLLEQLAALLDYRWSKRGNESARHYEIWQDLASKQREEALRQAAAAEPMTRLRDELQRLQKIAALTPAQIEQIVSDGEKRAEQLGMLSPVRLRELSSTPEERARRQRLNRAQTLSRPITQALVHFLDQLKAGEWSILTTTGQLRYSTDPHLGELPLPDDIVRELRASRPSTYAPGAKSFFPDPAAEERVRGRDQMMRLEWVTAPGFTVTLQMDTKLRPDGSLSLTAKAEPIRNGPPPRLAEAGVGFEVGGGSAGFTYGFMVCVSPAGASAEEGETPERREDLAKDPVLGRQKEFRPDTTRESPRDQAAGSFIQRFGPEIVRLYGVQIIADAYWPSTVVSIDRFPAEPVALFALLDRYTSTTHRWDREGSLLRLRSRTWFLDRPREVPLRLVRRWEAIYERQGALPLPEYLEMVVGLNDGQIGSLTNLANITGIQPDLYQVEPASSALRLYRALSPSQQQALWQGQRLPLARMSPSQRALAMAVLRQRPAPGGSTLAPQALTGVSFGLASEPRLRVRAQRAGATGYRELPISASAPVSPEGEVRHRVTRLTLRFQGVAGLPDGAEIVVATAPGTEMRSSR
jgi:beta-lactamase regulating signal transducer with metallopeptidase domain